jgi:hypothetical protein
MRHVEQTVDIVTPLLHGPVIFDKNRGCVAFDHQLEDRRLHPTYVSLPYIPFLDFWWRPFLGEKSVGVSL